MNKKEKQTDIFHLLDYLFMSYLLQFSVSLCLNFNQRNVFIQFKCNVGVYESDNRRTAPFVEFSQEFLFINSKMS